MPLRWDSLLARALAAELHDHLAGSRLRAIRLEGATRGLVLLFREATLAWSLHPTRGAPTLLPPADPAATDLPLPSRLRRVRAPPDERILLFELVPTRGHGPRELVVELLGNQWNALVVEGPDARIRHVLVRRQGRRPARVGEVYVPPPPSGREGVEAPFPLERWRAVLEGVPPQDRRRALVERVAWTSPVNAGSLVDAHEDPAVGLERGYAAWRAMAHDRRPGEPGLVEVGGGWQPYPWPLPGSEMRATGTLLEALHLWADLHAPDRGVEAAASVLPPQLVVGLERAVDSASRRATSLQAELDGLEDPDALRARADLLLARLREVPSGAREVVLLDFAGEPVRIALDPTVPAQDHAAALYDRAGRSERARVRLPALIEAARRDRDRLGELLARTRTGEATADEIEAALPRGGPPPTGAPGRAGDAGGGLPYRTFRSSGGLEIRVGKGARANDDLTFHHAAPDDVWMHARHAPGAHVVLRWGRAGNPPAKDLEEAAVLAALHSKARTSGTVPVDWTLRKYVRKPRRAAPGSVLMQRGKTIFVAPDPALAERLAEE